MPVITYATGNKSKFGLARDYFARHIPQIDFVQGGDANFAEPQTDDLGLIARQKAAHGHAHFGGPVLADDAGFYFLAYKNFPGFMSKYVYAALGYEGIAKLVAEDPRAEMRVYLAYDDGVIQKLFTGVVRGTIIAPTEPIPAGDGFAYSYFFAPEGYADSLSAILRTGGMTNVNARVGALDTCAQWLLAQYK